MVGSVAVGLARHSPVPLVIVPQGTFVVCAASKGRTRETTTKRRVREVLSLEPVAVMR